MGDGMTHVIIANDLRTGEIVYLTGEGSWTDEIAKARRFEKDTPDLESKLEEVGDGANTVVGIEAIALNGPSASETPVSLRDRIRATGPTVRPDLARPFPNA